MVILSSVVLFSKPLTLTQIIGFGITCGGLLMKVQEEDVTNMEEKFSKFFIDVPANKVTRQDDKKNN